MLLLIGSGLLVFAGMSAFSIEQVSAAYSVELLSFGMFLLLAGVAGPVRIMYQGAQIPAEIKRAIVVQAFVLPLSGVTLMVAGIAGTATYELWAFFITGICALLSALVAFYPLSKALPATFHIGEMLSIIKSAGITGDKTNSLADQAFLRWTKGRKGIPVGSPAADGAVKTLAGGEMALSCFFGEKPLVLNFGSYSCPHYRKRIGELQSLMQKWQHRGVDFLTIYTAEAHAEDGWKLEGQYSHDAEYTNEDDFCFPYAKNINDRKKMAEWLIDKKNFEMPLVLDCMDNRLLQAYNSWPIRLYIIDKGDIAYSGDQGPFGYNPASVDTRLQELMGRHANQ